MSSLSPLGVFRFGRQVDTGELTCFQAYGLIITQRYTLIALKLVPKLVKENALL